ncbi:MAG TPA: acyl-phosphate glycerol 3-phosphate acyltransferase [Sedimenticola sp.]|nr:acyl-phosphate glycerol 3-phosphate acyltransferase [Sedimenticola sp.]
METNRPEVTEAALLEIVLALARELYPGKRFPEPVAPDSALDKDLGFDSLGRMELLSRIERRFRVRLSEEAFAAAETLQDLFRLVRAAPSRGEAAVAAAGAGAISGPGRVGAPHGAGTLQEALAWHLERQGNRLHIYLYGGDEKPEEITYEGLYQGACKVAAGLRAHGLQPGRTVAIMLPTGRDYFFSFLGILLAGGIPAPIYPPARPSQIEDHLRRHARILDNAQAVFLVTVPAARLAARLLKSQVAGLRHIITPEELSGAGAGPAVSAGARPPDIAFLQYTSGSTGNPKGVMLTHANLLANLRAMGEAVQVSSDDVFVSWLPLYHDMGLIGAWLGSLYFGFPLVLMSPLAFLARPRRWLWAIHNHGGTLSAAPNFAYELCLSKLRDTDLEGLDLSSWRMAFNGAEPVSAQTVRRFCRRFGPYGFREEAMAPVFGLAESSVGLAFPPPGRKPLIDRINRQSLAVSGEALPAAGDDAQALEFVACGQALPGHSIRIVDPTGRELPERREGHLQFRGPSATSGYFRNPEETRRLFDGDWLNSGDLAYMADGDIYITSRVKDLIIRAGRNIYPYELEQAVGDVPGVRKGCVAVFGSPDPVTTTERIVILAETRETDPQRREKLRDSINALATDLLEMPPDEVVLAPPHTVLKTSSGKIRRAASRELFEQGRIGRPQRAVWLQITRLAMSGLVPQLRRVRRALTDRLYALYALTLFWCLAPPVWLLVAVVPGLSRRWRIIRAGARLLASLCGIPVHVEGGENLPPDAACILVANHASYIDGIALVAALPISNRFVVKAELKSNFIARVFLQRLESEFVERFDKQRGLEDARRLGERAHAGHPLLFFPEGTFTDSPGLLPFRMGAFAAAVEARIPVVPIAIRGSRSLLRGDSWLPSRGMLRITIGEPIHPAGSGWEAAIRLRDEARAVILDHCGEPDRGHDSPPSP